MFRLLDFLRSIYLVIIFIIVEGIAISHYASSNIYTRAKIFTVSNSILGHANTVIHNGVRLMELSHENAVLTEQIADLNSYIGLLESMRLEESLSSEELIFDNHECIYFVARVVSNSINKSDNFIILNKGSEDGIRENMALLTPRGEMLGYITGTTNHYSSAISVLSRSFTTSGKLKNGEHFGSIGWNGSSRYNLQMKDLSKYASVIRGDTIVSTGFSQIFPDGVTIGMVKTFELNPMRTAYEIDLEVAADISAIDYVLIVGRLNTEEVVELIEVVEN